MSSNDRLTEQSGDRNNAERLFDSQNNAKGGYSWGPKMYYYVGSSLSVEFTNQHSCGQENNDCDIVMQYMCGDDVRDGSDGAPANQNAPNTPSFCDPQTPADGCNKTIWTTLNTAGEPMYGIHESYDYYEKCYSRERNKGLFAADRNVNNNRGATSTRQNTNGNNVRNAPSQNGGKNHGYECPEERDYWPYWHPTPWTDIAVMTTRTSQCDLMRSTSGNVRSYGQCIFPNNVNYPVDADGNRLQGGNNYEACTKQSGTWVDSPAKGGGRPTCVEAPWSRDNHLGNTQQGHNPMFNWTIPNRPHTNCVLRLRYNITTRDSKNSKEFYDLRASDNGIKSPVTQDPAIFHSLNVANAPSAYKLKLALNTAETGRTFQDRSHVFEIRTRPSGVDPSRRIFNLNVRGKRGNIVQTYPATEYDFSPSHLHVRTGDYIHIQWTGSKDGAYPNGQDGEGRDKTDRSNMVSLKGGAKGGNLFSPQNETYGVPQPWDYALHVRLAWVDQIECNTTDELAQIAQQTGTNQDQLKTNCGKLNSLDTPYFDAGLVTISRQMDWVFISTRNNNFSNRSQKGIIVSTNLVQTFGIVLLSISGAAFLAAVVIAVVVKMAPSSALAASTVGV